MNANAITGNVAGAPVNAGMTYTFTQPNQTLSLATGLPVSSPSAPIGGGGGGSAPNPPAVNANAFVAATGGGLSTPAMSSYSANQKAAQNVQTEVASAKSSGQSASLLNQQSPSFDVATAKTMGETVLPDSTDPTGYIVVVNGNVYSGSGQYLYSSNPNIASVSAAGGGKTSASLDISSAQQQTAQQNAAWQKYIATHQTATIEANTPPVDYATFGNTASFMWAANPSTGAPYGSYILTENIGGKNYTYRDDVPLGDQYNQLYAQNAAVEAAWGSLFNTPYQTSSNAPRTNAYVAMGSLGGNIIGNPPSYQTQTLFPNQPPQPPSPSYSGSGWYNINGNLVKVSSQSDFYNQVESQGTTATSVGYIGTSSMPYDEAYGTLQAENFFASNHGNSKIYVENAPPSLLASTTTTTTPSPAYSYSFGGPGQTFTPALASPQYGINPSDAYALTILGLTPTSLASMSASQRALLLSDTPTQVFSLQGNSIDSSVFTQGAGATPITLTSSLDNTNLWTVSQTQNIFGTTISPTPSQTLANPVNPQLASEQAKLQSMNPVNHISFEIHKVLQGETGFQTALFGDKSQVEMILFGKLPPATPTEFLQMPYTTQQASAMTSTTISNPPSPQIIEGNERLELATKSGGEIVSGTIGLAAPVALVLAPLGFVVGAATNVATGEMASYVSTGKLMTQSELVGSIEAGGTSGAIIGIFEPTTVQVTGSLPRAATGTEMATGIVAREASFAGFNAAFGAISAGTMGAVQPTLFLNGKMPYEVTLSQFQYDYARYVATGATQGAYFGTSYGGELELGQAVAKTAGTSAVNIYGKMADYFAPNPQISPLPNVGVDAVIADWYESSVFPQAVAKGASTAYKFAVSPVGVKLETSAIFGAGYYYLLSQQPGVGQNAAIAGGLVAAAYPLGVSLLNVYANEPKAPNWQSAASGIMTQGTMVQNEPTPIGTGTISATEIAPSSYEMLINGGAEATAYSSPPEGIAIYPAAGNLGALYWTNDYYLNLGQAGTGRVTFAVNPASTEQAGDIYKIIYNTAKSRGVIYTPPTEALGTGSPLRNPITVSPATYTTREFIARTDVIGAPNVATSTLGSVQRWFQNTFGVQTSATSLGSGSSQYAVAENGASMSISQNTGPASQLVNTQGQAFVQYESTTWVDRLFGTSYLYTTAPQPIVTSVGAYLPPGAPMQTLVTTAGNLNPETVTEGEGTQITIAPDGRASFKSSGSSTVIVPQDTGVVRIGQYVGKGGVLSGGQFSTSYDMGELDKNIGIATTSEPWLDKILGTPTQISIDVNAGGGITNGYGQTIMSGAIAGNPQTSSYNGGLSSILETPPSATGYLLNFASAASPTETLQETFKLPTVNLDMPRGTTGYIYTLENQGYPSGVTVQQGDVSQFRVSPQKMSLFTGGAQSAPQYTFISFTGEDLPSVSALMASPYTPPATVSSPSIPASAWYASYFNIGAGEGGIIGSFNPFTSGMMTSAFATVSEGGQVVPSAEITNIASLRNIYPSWGTSPISESIQNIPRTAGAPPVAAMPQEYSDYGTLTEALPSTGTQAGMNQGGTRTVGQPISPQQASLFGTGQAAYQNVLAGATGTAGSEMQVLSSSQASQLNMLRTEFTGQTDASIQARADQMSVALNLNNPPAVTPMAQQYTGITGNPIEGFTIHAGEYNAELNQIAVNTEGLSMRMSLAQMAGEPVEGTLGSQISITIEHEEFHAYTSQLGINVANIGAESQTGELYQYSPETINQEVFVRGLTQASTLGGDVFYNTQTGAFTNAPPSGSAIATIGNGQISISNIAERGAGIVPPTSSEILPSTEMAGNPPTEVVSEAGNPTISEILPSTEMAGNPPTEVVSEAGNPTIFPSSGSSPTVTETLYQSGGGTATAQLMATQPPSMQTSEISTEQTQINPASLQSMANMATSYASKMAAQPTLPGLIDPTTITSAVSSTAFLSAVGLNPNIMASVAPSQTATVTQPLSMAMASSARGSAQIAAQPIVQAAQITPTLTTLINNFGTLSMINQLALSGYEQGYMNYAKQFSTLTPSQQYAMYQNSISGQVGQIGQINSAISEEMNGLLSGNISIVSGQQFFGQTLTLMFEEQIIQEAEITSAETSLLLSELGVNQAGYVTSQKTKEKEREQMLQNQVQTTSQIQLSPQIQMQNQLQNQVQTQTQVQTQVQDQIMQELQSQIQTQMQTQVQQQVQTQVQQQVQTQVQVMVSPFPTPTYAPPITPPTPPLPLWQPTARAKLKSAAKKVAVYEEYRRYRPSVFAISFPAFNDIAAQAYNPTFSGIEVRPVLTKSAVKILNKRKVKL